MERRVRAALGVEAAGSQPLVTRPAAVQSATAPADPSADTAPILPWLPGDSFADGLPSAVPSARPGSLPRQAPQHRLGLLERLRAVRVDPGRRGAAAVGAAAVFAAAATLVWVLTSRPHAAAIDATPGAPPSGTAGAAPAGAASGPAAGARGGGSAAPVTSATATGSAGVVVVDVTGRVRRPGLYRLPMASRVDDAIRAAGGPLPGVRLSTLNLAAKLVDGQQVAVGVTPAVQGAVPGAAGGQSPATGGTAAGPVDLNTASLDQLEGLPGVGPVLAQHILDWRTAHGQFATVDQLREVSGIGEVKFAALQPRVTV